ncbi:MAG: mechanosensitive ion channel family protein [Bryobacteraceae bacterium]
MDINAIAVTATAIATQVGLKMLGAAVLWFVGRRLIHFAGSILSKALARQSLDSTISGYIKSTVTVLLNIALIVALLGFFGVETTTFAALLAAGGVAIGVAWSGLLANFAAGVFIVILRPFKLGDFVTAGGVTGTIASIGLFGTTINTPDNVQTIVGNNKILSDNIQNFSSNPYRRVDLLAQLDHGADHNVAISLLKDRLAKIPNVIQKPAPEVDILQINMAGPVLAVRPYCSNSNYWQVYFDANKLIRESFGEAGFAVPEQRVTVRSA